MAFVYEVNGQKVEFEKEPSEADIDEAAKSLSQKPKREATGEDVATMAAQAAAPLGLPVESTGVMRPQPPVGPVQPPTVGYQFAPTGYNAQAVKDTLAPFKQAIPQTLAQYRGPGGGYKAFADLAVPAFTGGIVPPPTASIEALKTLPKVYDAGKEALSVLNEKTLGPDWQKYLRGGEYPETVKAYRDIRTTVKNLDPAYYDALHEARLSGKETAVKQLLENAPEALKSNPNFAAQAQRFTSSLPTMSQQAMRVAAPIVKGALRVAGPVGMAMSLNDAGQMARETELGSRLQQGQGQRAEQAFRNMNTQYGGPISPQEEQNVMANGSQRDIQALIRKKAAERVLGPVAPR
jgi:hypothetical protein